MNHGTVIRAYSGHWKSNVTQLKIILSFSTGNDELFWSVTCCDGKNIVFCMLGRSMIHKNKFYFKVMNAVITRVLFFLHVGTLYDELKQISFWSDECSYCKRTVFSTLHNANNTKTSTGTNQKVSLQSKGFSPIERFLSIKRVSLHSKGFSPFEMFLSIWKTFPQLKCLKSST